MSVILLPGDGITLTALVRLVMDISDGPRNAVRVTAGGVLVDDATALAYLRHVVAAAARTAAEPVVTIIEPDPPHPPPPPGTGDPDAPPPEPSPDPEDLAPAPPEGPATAAPVAGPRRANRRRTTIAEGA